MPTIRTKWADGVDLIAAASEATLFAMQRYVSCEHEFPKRLPVCRDFWADPTNLTLQAADVLQAIDGLRTGVDPKEPHRSV